jgi:hypothetical protein
MIVINLSSLHPTRPLPRPFDGLPPFLATGTLTLNTDLFLAQPETDGCEQCEHGSHQPKGGPKGGRDVPRT